MFLKQRETINILQYIKKKLTKLSLQCKKFYFCIKMRADMKKVNYSIVFNRRSKLNSQGEGVIDLCVNSCGIRRYLSTGIKIKPAQWDKRRRCIRAGVPNAAAMNRQIQRELEKLQAAEWSMRDKGISPSTPSIIQNGSNRRRYADFVGFVMSDFMAGRHVEKSTQINYRTLCNHLTEFRPGLNFDGISYEFIVEFHTYLLTDVGVSINTAAKNMSFLRSAINEAIRRDLIDKNPFSKYTIRREQTERAYLTPDEVNRLEDLPVLSPALRETLDMFLTSIYTGLRFSDISRLCPGHIATENGEKWLKIVMKKTGQSIEIPVSALFGGKALAILTRYDKGPQSRYFTKGAAIVNRELKQIAKMAGIEKNVTFHCARHTTGTYLMNKNIPENVVQMILGHKDIKTTQIYSKTMRDTVDREIKRAFYEK